MSDKLVDFVNGEAEALLSYVKESPLPYLKDFCNKRGYPSTRMSDFVRTSEKFCDAFIMAKDVIETKLFYAAITGKVNPTFAIFAMKNIAGWRDRFHFDLPTLKEESRMDGQRLEMSEATVKQMIKTLEDTRSGKPVPKTIDAIVSEAKTANEDNGNNGSNHDGNNQ